MRKRNRQTAEFRKYVDDLVAQFHQMFPTEEECTMVLGDIDYSSDEGPRCRRCQNILRQTKKSARAYWCTKCKMTVWITAGTFFAKKHCSSAWLLAIWLREHSVSLGSIELGQRLGVAQSSGWRINRDLNAVMLEELEEHSGWTHSRFFQEVFSRRSLETSKRKPPVSEQDDYEQEYFAAREGDDEAQKAGTSTNDCASEFEQAVGLDELAVAGSQERVSSAEETNGTDIDGKFFDREELSEVEELVYNQLSENPQHLEVICEKLGGELNIGAVFSALTQLELRGLVRGFSGSLFARVKAKVASNALPATFSDVTAQSLGTKYLGEIEKFLQYVCDVFHGISRKYLQSYLAGYWVQVSSRWENGALLRACLSRSRPWCSTIVHKVTPLVVKIPLPDSARLAITGS